MPNRPVTASVTIWHAPPLPDPETALSWLGPDERSRAASFRHAIDRARFVTGRAMTRALLAERLGVTPAAIDLRICARESATPGKPHVPGAPPFSIAHAGDWVLVAVVDSVSEGRPGQAGQQGPGPPGPDAGEARGDLAPGAGVHVGVDVESTSPARDHLGDLLDAVPHAERPGGGWTPESFTRSWVRREAVLKAVGTGLLAPRDDLLLTPADRPAAVVRSGGALPGPDRLALADVDVAGASPSTGVGVTLGMLDGRPQRSGASPSTGVDVTLGMLDGRPQRSGASPSAGASFTLGGGGGGAAYLAAVALCSPHGPVALGSVGLADGLTLLARHGLVVP
ncbi:4'-phosphopantetheinyl transferase family protein [Oerskovia turbata]